MRMQLCAVLLLLMAGPALAQSPADRERARTHNRLGWEALRSEKYAEAIKSFRTAIDIRPDYEYAHYGLGRAYLASRRYPDAAVILEKCRDLYRAQGSRQFSNVQDAQRFREDRLIEIDEQIRLLRSGPQTQATQDLVRQYETARRDLQENIRRNQGLTIDVSVPPWVSLSLGSAYFRSGQMADAERAYLDAVKAEPKLGEAHNNLAVVYLESGRITDALTAMESAKKTGFKVNPQLEREIRARVK